MSDNLREWTVAEMAADAGAPEGRIRDIIRRLEITPRRKDSAGNIYMPAACLDIEGASCPDIIGIIMAARDGQPIAMIEGHAFVRIEWVARTWPHMTAAVDQIGRKVAATLAGYDPLNDSPSNPPQ
jgi:hypothetical protein